MAEIGADAAEGPVVAGGIVDAAGRAEGPVAAGAIVYPADRVGEGTRKSLPRICADVGKATQESWPFLQVCEGSSSSKFSGALLHFVLRPRLA